MKCPRCGCDGVENIGHIGEPDLFNCDECYTAWWIIQYHPKIKLNQKVKK